MLMFAPALPVSSAAESVVVAWQRRRAEFTHDWLRNRFLPRVLAYLTLGRSGVRAGRQTVESLAVSLREWPARGGDSLQLADEFCEIMSPLRVVENIASTLSPGVASFLRHTALESWKLRHQVPALIDDVRSAYHAANESYVEWAASDSEIPLQAMALECERLARTLSKLPSRVCL